MFKNNFEPHYLGKCSKSEKPLKSALSNQNTGYSKKNVDFCSEIIVYSYPRAEYEDDDYDDVKSTISDDEFDVLNTPSGLQLRIQRPLIISSPRSSTTSNTNNSKKADKSLNQNYPPEDYMSDSNSTYPYTRPPIPPLSNKQFDYDDSDCPTNFGSNINNYSATNSAEKSKQQKKVKKLEKKSKNCCCGFIYRQKLKKERKKLLMM